MKRFDTPGCRIPSRTYSRQYEEWQTEEQRLRELRDRARDFAEGFETFAIQHIPREENWKADALVEKTLSDR